MPEEREALLDRYCNKLDVGCNVCLVAICAHICVRIYLAISTSIAELFIIYLRERGAEGLSALMSEQTNALGLGISITMVLKSM